MWIFIASLFAQEPSSADLMQKAFEREFTHLFAEKNTLETQKKEYRKRSLTSVQELEQEILKLQRELVKQKSYGMQLVDKKQKMEIQLGEKSDIASSFLSLIQSAEQDLGLDLPKEDSSLNKFVALCTEQRKIIQNGRQISQSPGTFFQADGQQVEGQILRLGEIAAFGKYANTLGSLIPIGKQELQIHTTVGAKVAEDMFAGKSTVAGEFFLVEGFSQAITLEKDRTLYETLQAGGIVAWVIAILGGFGVFVALIRAILLSLSPLRGLNEEAELQRLQEEGQSKLSFLSKMWNSTPKAHDQLLEEAEAELIGMEAKTNRFAVILPVIAAVAPLLGLLGTVTGMISTFEIITEHGTGDPRMLSSGISEALITTQLGLIVAIPMLLFGNMLKSWSKSQLVILESLILRVVSAQSTSHQPPPLPQEAK